MYKDLSVQDKKCFRKKFIKETLKNIGGIILTVFACLIALALIAFAIQSIWGVVLIGLLLILFGCIRSGYEDARKEQQERESAREQIIRAKSRIVKYTDFINEALLDEEEDAEKIERNIQHWKNRIQEEEKYIIDKEEYLKKLGG